MKETVLSNRVSRRDFLKGAALLGAAGLVATTGSSLLTGCAPKSSGPASVRFQPAWIPDMQNGGNYAAISQGYYEKEQLTVEILPGGPGILGGTVVDSGDAELGEMASSVDLVKAFSQGTKLMAFATVFQRSPSGLAFISKFPDGTVGADYSAGPVALKGKRVGIQGGPNLPWRVMCKDAGLDAEADFEVVNVGYDLAPLLDGTVDAIWCFLTNQPGMVRGQGYEIGTIDSYQFGYKVPGNFYITKPTYLEDNMDVACRWLRATRKGWEYANSNCSAVSEDVTSKLAETYGTQLEQQVSQCQDQIPFMESDLTKKKGLLYVNMEDWENAIKILSDIGELESVPKVEDFVTTTVLDKM
ncbi:MAG: ABC transporter substrate-binding protein [Anaerolineaceae bacterium]